MTQRLQSTLHLGTTDKRNQWCNRLPLGKGGSVVRRILLVLAAAAVMVTSMVPAVAVTMVPVAVMIVTAEPAEAKNDRPRRPQPTSPPGNPDSYIRTGRSNRDHAVLHGNPGGPIDKGPSQAVVAPSLVQQV